MSKTNSDNLEARFDAGEDVLDYFETETVITVQRLQALAPLVKLERLAEEAGLDASTLLQKVEHSTPLTSAETRALVRTFLRFRLHTVA